MDKKRVYVETTVISYLAARQTRDAIRRGRQELTRDWWDTRRDRFDVYVSPLVVSEAKEGDPEAVMRRLAVLSGLPVLDAREEADELADELIQAGVLPEVAADDAAHLAIATVHGMDFLVTWNCTHLANAELTEPIAEFLRARGYRPPVICTPQQLYGV